MNHFLRSVFVLIISFFSSCKQETKPLTPNIIRAEVLADLQVAADSMEVSANDVAEQFILKHLNKSVDSISSMEKYYLYAFEAEIFYYSALFDQGINSILKARKQAELLNDKKLIGSCENILGLLYSNKNLPDTALKHFRIALNLLPELQNSKWLSKQFHVYNNMGEAFLKLNQPDSVIYNARKSLNICKKLKDKRGMVFAYWTLSEAMLQKSNPEKAIQLADSGIALCSPNKIMDGHLFLLVSKINAASQQNNKPIIYSSLEAGKDVSNSTLSTPYSKIEFLKQAVQSLIKIGDFEKAAPLQQQLINLEEKIRLKEEKIRMDILVNYFQNEQHLFQIQQEKSKQEAEFRLTRYLNISLIAFLVSVIVAIIFYRNTLRQKEKLQKLHFEKEKEDIQREQEALRNKSRLDAIEEERNRIALELHDDIGSSISSINIYSNIAIESIEKNTDKSLDLIHRIKQQSYEISENLSDLIWAIYSGNDTYGQLFQRMKNFSFEILGAKDIYTQFEFSTSIQNHYARIDILKNILLFFKESVNNIAKYSGATEVKISLTELNSQLTLIIEDNGKGFDRSIIIEGNGLNSFNVRAKSLDGTCEIVSIPGKGTRISMSFKDSSLDTLVI
jgi:signal transduction histidine kinase